MIGDLHQLPPVVKPEDWELLRPHYETTYFFGIRASLLGSAQDATITQQIKCDGDLVVDGPIDGDLDRPAGE